MIIITHALSGSHHAAGTYEGDRKAGWWDSFIGDGKAVDTTKYFVICMNNIGSCFGSTSPQSPHPLDGKPYRFRFPVLTISDIVRAQIRVLKSLDISLDTTFRAKNGRPMKIANGGQIIPGLCS